MKLERKSKNFIFRSSFQIFVVLLLLNSYAVAQPELSGFFDGLSIFNSSEGNTHKFMINQFEFDVSYAHESHFSVGTAVAFNNETENMELAMAFVHYSFDGGPGKHPRREETYDHSALLIGKFDMPFGLDYLSFASIDRPTITQPLVIEKTIAGWNDIGIDFHMFAGNFKFDVWAVNGFAEGIGLGGNIRYTLFPFLEVGYSHSSDIVELEKREDWLNGVDLVLTTEIFQLKSEYLWMNGVYEGEQDTLTTSNMHKGLYFQLLTELEKWTSLPMYLTLRYGYWDAEFDRDESGIKDGQNRVTAALGYRLNENIVIRAEVVSNYIQNGDRENQGILQFAVGF